MSKERLARESEKHTNENNQDKQVRKNKMKRRKSITTFLIAAFLAMALAPFASGQTIIINTGWDHHPTSPGTYLIGAADGYWKVTSDMDPGTIEPRSSWVIAKNPAYMPALPGSQWISSRKTSSCPTDGKYCFEFYFCLEDGFTNASLELDLRADDSAAVYLNKDINPNPIGGALDGSWGSIIPGSASVLPSNGFPFKVGVNRITVEVENLHGVAMGLNVAGSVTATSVCMNHATKLINTGYDHTALIPPATFPIGAADGYWKVTCDTDPTTFEPRSSWVIAKHPNWKPAEPNSEWISSLDEYSCLTNGDYCFEYYFCLKDCFTDASLELLLRADDAADVYLNKSDNPLPIGSVPAGSWGSANPFPISTITQSLFKPGVNCIRVEVENLYGVAMGLNVAGSVTACGLLDGATISGTKFEDLNGNSVWEPLLLPDKEEGLYKFEIELTGTDIYGNSVLQPDFTNTLGEYMFSGLMPGSYHVKEMITGINACWTQTFPLTVFHTFDDLQWGEHETEINFGNDTCDDVYQPIYIEHICLHGEDDNFLEPPQPPVVSSGLALFLTGQYGDDIGFDTPANDDCFGHTFENCFNHNKCKVYAATLRIKLRAGSGQPYTDWMALGDWSAFTLIPPPPGPNGRIWSISLNDLEVEYAAGTSPWTYGEVMDVTLDLADLWIPSGSWLPTNILGALQNDSLDIVISDDTEVDLIELHVWLCCNPCKGPAYIYPDTHYVFEAFALDPLVDTVYCGNFDDCSVDDIDTSNILINYSIPPTSVAVLNEGEYPDSLGLSGSVMEVTVDTRDFILSYGLLFDTTVQQFSVSGTLNAGGGFAAYGDIVMIGHRSGDVNMDGGVNVADVTYLVGYLFAGGPPPRITEAGDIDGDCAVNIADLTYLVDYLFNGGDEPQQPCSGAAGAPTKSGKARDDILLNTTYDDGTTVISLESAVDLRGIQIELSGEQTGDPVKLVDDDLELFFHQKDGSGRIGILDMQGSALIQKGSHPLVRLPGKYEIVEAIVSDLDHNALVPAINPVAKGTNLPTEFALSQNYPNPFNPTTEIGFSLPNAADVKLEVYNIMGQQVATIVDRQMEAGRHSVTWDSKNDKGHDVSSGVYFYRLEAGSFTETKKMMLLK